MAVIDWDSELTATKPPTRSAAIDWEAELSTKAATRDWEQELSQVQSGAAGTSSPQIQPEIPQMRAAPDSREELAKFAKKQLKEAWFPNITARSVGATSGMIAPIARLFGASNTADYLNRFADAYSSEIHKLDQQQGIWGAVKEEISSPITMLPAVTVGVATGGSGTIATFAAQAMDRAAAKGRDEGLSGPELRTYVATQGLVEGVPYAIADRFHLGGVVSRLGKDKLIPVVKGLVDGLKHVGITSAQQAGLSTTTAIGHSVVDAISGVDPEAADPATLAATAKEAAIQGAIAGGMFSAGHLAGRRLVGVFAKGPPPTPLQIQQDIMATAEANQTPSRKQWKTWGLDPEQGKTAKGRAEGLQAAAESLRQQTQPQTPLEQPALETRPEAIVEPITAAKKEWDVFKVGTETVVKNPTDADVRDIVKRFNEAHPNAPKGTVKVRNTFDTSGNKYSWIADKTHADIEPAINRKFGTTTNQNEYIAAQAVIQQVAGQLSTEPALAATHPEVVTRSLQKQTPDELKADFRKNVKPAIQLEDGTILEGKHGEGHVDVVIAAKEAGHAIAYDRVTSGWVYQNKFINAQDVTEHGGPFPVTPTTESFQTFVPESVTKLFQHEGPKPEIVAEGVQQAIQPVEMPFIEQLKQQAFETLPKPKGFLKEETGALGQLGIPERTDVVGVNVVTPDLSTGIPEVDARMTAAKGIPKLGLKERVIAGLGTAKNYLTRAQVNVPNTPEFAVFNETTRLIKVVPTIARDDAIRIVAAITQPMGPTQFELFSKYSIIQNQLAAAELGQPLRFGFTTKEQVTAYKDKLQALVDTTPVVKQALENRTKAVQDIVGAAVNYNLLPETALQNSDTYFHQQVLAYQAARGGGVGAAVLKTVRKSFQRKRFAEPGIETLDATYDYNTDYLQSEIAWMSDALESVRKEQHLDRIYAEYDRYSTYRDMANKLNVPLSKVVHDSQTHDIYQPKPGNAFYRAYSIPDKIAEQLQKGELKSFDLTPDQVREVLAVGAQRKPAVLPKEIVAELEGTLKPASPHWLDKLNLEAMRAWKVWTLLNPARIIPYNVRNMTGDIDPIIASNPAILSYFKQSTKEIWQMLRQPTAKMTPSMMEARTHGVTASGFFTEEIGEVGGLKAFRYLDTHGDQALRALQRPDQAYLDIVRPITEAREDLARYAAFLYYKDALKQNKLVNYGASKKPIIDAIRAKMGDTAAAAKLARELVGDYGNISAFGSWFSARIYPFWRWSEINMTRYPRLALNSFQEAGLREGLGTSASIAKMYAAAATMRIGAVYGGLYVWNNLVSPAIFGGQGDDDLPPYERANPHVTIGNTPEGDKQVFRNVGALGDFLEWFGLNEAVAMIPLYRSGQVGLSDIAKEMLKSPLEKMVGGLRPDVKGGYEILTGQSLFPSPFEPRSVERGEAAANVLGLGQEYKWAKGMVLGTGDRPRKNYWIRMLGLATVNPRSAALNEIYDLRSRYVASKGSPEQGQFPISEYKVAREAATNEDYNAFVDWKLQFQKKHPFDSASRFGKFLKRMDPIASRLNERDELEFEHKYLTNEQRAKLRIARDYSHELRDRLLVWWKASGQSSNQFVK